MLNSQLRDQLLELKAHDIEVRERLAQTGELFDGYNPEMEKVHQSNARVLQEIVSEHGWPGEDLVGPEGADAAWFILQHDIGEPEVQRSFVPILEGAVNQGKIPAKHLAYLVDRICMYEGRPQIYGTQFDWDADGNLSPVSIEDEKNVDNKRSQVGLPPIAEVTSRMRREAKELGETPPQDYRAYRQRAVDWAIATGWRN